jgi:hypothetical protein
MKIHKEIRLTNPDNASEYILQRAFSDAEGHVWFQFETNLPTSWLIALSRDRKDSLAYDALNTCLNLIAQRYGWAEEGGLVHMKCMIDTALDVSTFDWKTSPASSSTFLICTAPDDIFKADRFHSFCTRNLSATSACAGACDLLNKVTVSLNDLNDATPRSKHPLERLIASWPKDVDDMFLTRQDGVTPLVAHLRDRTDASIIVDLHAIDNDFYEVRSPMFTARPRLNLTSPSAFLLQLSTLS